MLLFRMNCYKCCLLPKCPPFMLNVARIYLYKNSVMQWYVTLGVPWAAARWQDNYENVGVPQTARDVHTENRVFRAVRYDPVM
jgi:hypothetical protein